MLNFYAQLTVNHTPVWEAKDKNYVTLQSRLLSQLEVERNGAMGFIQEKNTEAIIFRCRKVASE